MNITWSYPDNWEELKILVKKRDNYRCTSCNTTYPANSPWLHVHHIVPLSKGGSNKPCNLTTLCYSCHKSHHPHMGKSRKTSSKKFRTSKSRKHSRHTSNKYHTYY